MANGDHHCRVEHELQRADIHVPTHTPISHDTTVTYKQDTIESNNISCTTTSVAGCIANRYIYGGYNDTIKLLQISHSLWTKPYIQTYETFSNNYNNNNNMNNNNSKVNSINNNIQSIDHNNVTKFNSNGNDNTSNKCDGSMILCGNLCVCIACQSLPNNIPLLSEAEYYNIIAMCIQMTYQKKLSWKGDQARPIDQLLEEWRIQVKKSYERKAFKYLYQT